jgi:hypothetical protein
LAQLAGPLSAKNVSVRVFIFKMVTSFTVMCKKLRMHCFLARLMKHVTPPFEDLCCVDFNRVPL